jgi:hypothetical protein
MKDSTELVLFIFFIVAVVGWIRNIVKLVGYDGEFSGFLIVRAVGIIVAPLGSILGFF